MAETEVSGGASILFTDLSSQIEEGNGYNHTDSSDDEDATPTEPPAAESESEAAERGGIPIPSRCSGAESGSSVESNLSIPHSEFYRTSSFTPMTLLAALDPVVLASVQLVVGAEQGNVELILSTLETGADVNAKFDGRTALHVAAANDQAEIVKLLLHKGADVNAIDRAGRTPLQEALVIKSEDMVGRLRAAGGEIGHTETNWTVAGALCRAAGLGDIEEMRTMVAAGAPVNEGHQYGDLRGPLHLAASCGQLESVRFLLNHGAVPNVLDRRANTPLDDALSAGFDAIVELLQAHGARKGLKVMPEDMQKAVTTGDPERLNKLVQRGVDVNAADAEGRTPIFLAVMHKKPTIVQRLIQLKAEVMQPNRDGLTPLHIAARDKLSEICDILLDAGADPGLPDGCGDTPLMIAQTRGCSKDVINRMHKIYNEVSMRKAKEARDLKSPTQTAAAPQTFRLPSSPAVPLQPSNRVSLPAAQKGLSSSCTQLSPTSPSESVVRPTTSLSTSLSNTPPKVYDSRVGEVNDSAFGLTTNSNSFSVSSTASFSSVSSRNSIKSNPPTQQPSAVQFMFPSTSPSSSRGSLTSASHPMTSSADMKGPLKLQSVKFHFTRWKSYWFELRGHKLYYYSEEFAPKPGGDINLKTAVVVDGKQTALPKNTFMIQLMDGNSNKEPRSYVLQANSGNEAKMWVDVIHQAVEQARGPIEPVSYKLFDTPAEEQAMGGITLEDFHVAAKIGVGNFAKVLKVVHKASGEVYAMKVMRKDYLQSRKMVEPALNEKAILQSLHHPFIVSLKYAFQDSEKLYLVMDYLGGGELGDHLRRVGTFPEDLCRHYAAEISLALHRLHEFGTIYRDLKAENLVLDSQGHVVLTDFGIAKSLSSGNLARTFCGTPECMAPEIVKHKKYTSAVDWWSLGILLYQMLVGRGPFLNQSVDELYRSIMHQKVEYPSNISPNAKAFISSLLEKDENQRLRDLKDIKTHRFFDGLDWNKLVKREIIPPLPQKMREALAETARNEKTGPAVFFNNFDFSTQMRSSSSASNPPTPPNTSFCGEVVKSSVGAPTLKTPR